MGCNSGKIALAEFNDLADERKSFHHRYKLGNCIGAGAQGSVFLARRVDSNDEFAVKVLHILGYGSQANSSVRRKQAFTNERIAWAQVGGHPNICSLQEWFIDNHFGYFVMEHCPSSLFSAWKGEPYLNEHTYANYFKDMASALAHIHSVGVVHKDVKHANFLLGGPSGRTTMLCDFGLSTLLSDHNAMMTKERGTPPYMAPEMVKRNAPCGTACDLWSFGVIAYVAFFGEWPYCAEEITPEAVKEAGARDVGLLNGMANTHPKEVGIEGDPQHVKIFLDQWNSASIAVVPARINKHMHWRNANPPSMDGGGLEVHTQCSIVEFHGSRQA